MLCLIRQSKAKFVTNISIIFRIRFRIKSVILFIQFLRNREVCTHPYLERRSCRNVSRVGAGACAVPIWHRSSPSAQYRLQIKEGFAMSSLLLFRIFTEQTERQVSASRPNCPPPMQASVSPLDPKRGKSNTRLRGEGRGDPIRTTGQKGWQSVYYVEFFSLPQ